MAFERKGLINFKDLEKPKFSQVKNSEGVVKKYILNFQNSFRFVKKLGEGGFGNVSLYENNYYKYSRVALKSIRYKGSYYNSVLHKEIPAMRDTFQKCGSTIEIFDLFILRTRKQINIIIVMEYINGSDLYNSITKDLLNIDSDFVFFFSKWLFETLDCIHRNNWVHGDVKLENILVRKDTKELLIGDFGLACFFKRSNLKDDKSYCNSEDVGGTLEYNSPEMYMDFSKLTNNQIFILLKKADVWACCVTIYILMFGRWPWKKIEKEEIKKEILEPNKTLDYEYSINTKKVRTIKTILNMGLEYDYKKRSSAEEILRILNGI